YFFFFSSRRRHTRSKRDWSSDVCSSDLEHVALPQVQLSSALVDRRGVRDCDLDALNGAVNGRTSEVASETNNIRIACGVNGIRLQHGAAKDRTNRTVVVACVREERIRTGAGGLRQTNSPLKLRGNQPVRKITVSNRNCLKRSSKI